MGKGRGFRTCKGGTGKFEGRMNVEVRRQEKLEMAEKKNFKRGELLGKFMAKMLYR